MTRLALALMLMLAPLPSLAAESQVFSTERDQVSLVSDTDAVAPGAEYHLGLRFRLAPGWHIYHRNSGDAGLPPELRWTLPSGVHVGDIIWPAPERLTEGQLVTFGFTGSPLLVLTAQGAGAIQLHASWLVCNNICVPEEADFALNLAQGSQTPATEAALFAQAATHQPVETPFRAVISPQGVLAVSGEGLGHAAPVEAFFVADEPDVIAAGPQSLSAMPDGFSLTLKPAAAFKADALVAGVVVLRDAGGQLAALRIAAQPGAVAAGVGWIEAIFAALLGGLILNLMPCVFPVLAMKAMAILRVSSEGRKAARTEALAYSSGVILSFTAIGGAVLALRQLGHAVGWGFQFQSPWFVAGMAWLLMAVGLNLSGVFEISSSRVAGAGQGLTLRGGALGSFFSGVLAVLVATPCTAPFMSVALAAALTAPPTETLAVFAALGIGLASPALVLAAFPGMARALPRPGRWMEIMKQALAFPIYAASAWLIWVLSTQSGPSGTLLGVAGLVLVGLAAWLFGLDGIWGKRLAVLSLVGLVLGAVEVGLPEPSNEPSTTTAADRFTPQRLAELRAQHRPVFIDMTAAWCVTCLVNERVALHDNAVQAAFAQHNVAQLVGDWTRQDPAITNFLHGQGRDGVPLYVYYPPDRDAVLLPQILTPQNVLAAIN